MVEFARQRQYRDTNHVEQIKRWIVAAFAPGEDTVIMVTELQCREPGCPPLETVIALLHSGGPAERLTLHKPLAEVTEHDIRSLTRS